MRPKRMHRRQDGGFTVVEALVVLVIIGLLAGLATIAFRRHFIGKRVAEATSMLSELASKEEAYRAGGGRFLALRADGDGAVPSRDELPAAFYPQPADSVQLASARTPTRIEDPSLWPPSWRAIGVRPHSDLSYCTYLVNAGERGRPDPSLRFGSALITADSDGPWFYALAVCNLEGRADYPDGVTVYGVSSESGRVRAFNEGR
jgi:prepilin-type N-terminal cleavage/methylation domain-containing protein